MKVTTYIFTYILKKKMNVQKKFITTEKYQLVP
jgi:hypothetical protein